VRDRPSSQFPVPSSPFSFTTMRLTLVLAALALAGCMTQDEAEKGLMALSAGPRPDSLPVMLNDRPPFLYPPELYDKRVQGNVTLRVFIDSTGAVSPDSTSVATSSGYSALDSAAVKGSERLRFAPAKKGNRPMGVAVLLPVFFRYPGAPPLPGDTILSRYRRGTGNGRVPAEGGRMGTGGRKP
jgi:TonB family protein